MKCPIHGIEEVWQGSILKGNMVCEECEQAKEDAEIKVSIQPYTEDPIPRFTISNMGSRIALTNSMINIWKTDPARIIICPYCGTASNAYNAHFAGSVCEKDYTADCIKYGVSPI